MEFSSCLPGCGGWGSSLPTWTFFHNNSLIQERQREEERIRQLMKERSDLERELKLMKKKLKKIEKEEEKRKREEKRQREEQAQWMKWIVMEWEKVTNKGHESREELKRLRELYAQPKLDKRKVKKVLLRQEHRKETQDVPKSEMKEFDLEKIVKWQEMELLKFKEVDEVIKEDLEMFEGYQKHREEKKCLDPGRETLLLLQGMQMEIEMEGLTWMDREQDLQTELQKMKRRRSSLERSREKKQLPLLDRERELESLRAAQREKELKRELEDLQARMERKEQQLHLEREEMAPRTWEKKESGTKEREEKMKREQEVLEELEETCGMLSKQLEVERRAAKKKEMAMLEKIERQRESERREMEREMMERQRQMENELQERLREHKRELEREKQNEQEQEERLWQAKERLKEMERKMMEEGESALREEEKWREVIQRQEDEWHHKYLEAKRMREENMRVEEEKRQEMERERESIQKEKEKQRECEKLKKERAAEMMKQGEWRDQQLELTEGFREREKNGGGSVETSRERVGGKKERDGETDCGEATTDGNGQEMEIKSQHEMELEKKEREMEEEVEEGKERTGQGDVTCNDELAVMVKEESKTKGEMEIEGESKERQMRGFEKTETETSDEEEEREEQINMEMEGEIEENNELEKETKGERLLEIERMQEARRQHMEKQKKQKKEIMKRMFGKESTFRPLREFGRKRSRKFIPNVNQEEKEEEKLQQPSWPVSPNGGLQVVYVKPLSSSPDPACPSTPLSTADPTPSSSACDPATHPTTEASVRDESSAGPEEPASAHQSEEQVSKSANVSECSTEETEETSHDSGTTDTIEELRDLVVRPAPLGTEVKCCIVRDYTTTGSHFGPKYFMFQENEDGTKEFLLSARNMNKTMTANYAISVDSAGLSFEGENVVGKLRSNIMGTEFTLYNATPNPSTTSKKGRGLLKKQSPKQELAAICYKNNFMGEEEREMTIILPGMNMNSEHGPVQPKDQGSLLHKWKKNKLEDFIHLCNKKAKWNNAAQCYALDGCAVKTRNSRRDFQLICPGIPHINMLFVREADNEFILRYSHPMSALQAFSIGLSSIHYKLACA